VSPRDNIEKALLVKSFGEIRVGLIAIQPEAPLTEKFLKGRVIREDP